MKLRGAGPVGMGVALIVAGITLNQTVIERTLVPGGRIESSTFVVPLLLAQFTLVTGGMFFLVRRPRVPIPAVRDLAIPLTLASASALIGVILVEIGLRFFSPAPRGTSILYRNDGVLGYSLKPNLNMRFNGGDYRVTVSTDSRGFRTVPPLGPEYHRADINIMVVGDSYAFGLGVNDDETFPHQLQTSLQARWAPATVKVWNLGVPGYGFTQVRLQTEKHIDDVDPDVIWLMMVSNDPEDELGWSLGHDFMFGDAISRAKEHNPTEVRRYLDIVIKKTGLLRSIWLPSPSIPPRTKDDWDGFRTIFPRVINSEFVKFGAIVGNRIVYSSLINYNLLERDRMGTDAQEPDSISSFKLELTDCYVQIANEYTRFVALGQTPDTDIFDIHGGRRTGYWNTHHDSHLSPDGNAAIARTMFETLNASKGMGDAFSIPDRVEKMDSRLPSACDVF